MKLQNCSWLVVRALVLILASPAVAFAQPTGASGAEPVIIIAILVMALNFFLSGLVKVSMWNSWKLFHHWGPIHGLVTLGMAFGAFLAVHALGFSLFLLLSTIFKIFPAGSVLLLGGFSALALTLMAITEAWGNRIAFAAAFPEKKDTPEIISQCRSSALGFVVILILFSVFNIAFFFS
ncbi:MAG: hypothetical protein WA705_23870 [Candidatus Ozemobacteraceae bacterium]